MMLFQGLGDQRVLLAFTTQLILIAVNSVLACVTLKRERTRSTILLSLFYAPQIVGFATILLSTIKIFPFACYAYKISAFIIILGMPALTLFTVSLIRQEESISKKVQTIYLISCLVVSSYLFFFFPDGIRLDETTDWIPVYSWQFSLLLIIFVSSAYVVPETYLLLKIYRSVVDKNVKARLRLFFLGLYIYLVSNYGIVLYNTWIDNQIYRTIYSVFAFFIFVPSVLIYFGIRKEISK